MPVLPAILVVALGVFYYLSKTSDKVPGTVTFAKPTTVIPAATAVVAAGAAVALIVLTDRAGLSALWVLGLGPLVGLVILRLGGSTAGSRVVYDRGGLRIGAGKLVGVVAVAVFCLVALIS